MSTRVDESPLLATVEPESARGADIWRAVGRRRQGGVLIGQLLVKGKSMLLAVLTWRLWWLLGVIRHQAADGRKI